jgi:acyl-coenzyme A synthetase/AMP-(fatty) acid ligase
MLKIAGKRASLNELNRLLNDIDGVEDGFFFVITDSRTDNRLGAVVVSQLDKSAIKHALAPHIDEVLLPKKIHFVDRIPRNPAGKLLQTEQEKLLSTLNLLP